MGSQRSIADSTAKGKISTCEKLGSTYDKHRQRHSHVRRAHWSHHPNPETYCKMN